MPEDHNNVIRVLHMIGSLEIGGSQMMILNLYRSIDRDKIQFDFIIDHSNGGALIPEVKALGARVYIMPQFKGYNILEIKKAWNLFFKTHPEYKILHSHVRSYASIYIHIAKKYGLKTIIHSHSTSNGTGFSSLGKRILQYPLRYQADYLFACSKEAGEWLFGKRALENDNFKIIRNGIDCDRFQFDEKNREKIRKEYGIEDNFVIGHVGRHTSAKNPIFLLEIFSEIYKKDSNARLLQVGQGEMTERMKQKCHDLGIEQAVIFAGVHNDVEKYYSAMDVFLFPSLWEGLGIVVVEAQTNGLQCVVSTEVPVLADIGAGMFHVLDLQESAETWASLTHSFSKSKRLNDKVEFAQHSGYDIKDMAYNLSKFYLSMYQ